MSLNLALVISGDAAGAKRAVQETREAVQHLGSDSGRAAAAIIAANDQSVASARRVTETLIGQTAAQRQLQQAIDAMISRGSPTADVGYRQRAADIAAYGDEMDRLRTRFNPLFAASKAYEAELNDLSQAHRLGAISEAEHGVALDALNARFLRLQTQSAAGVVSLGRLGSASGLTANQFLNLSRQGNDVITMLALGASPLQVFASQAGQVYDALESGPRGLRGSLAGIGIAARQAALGLAAFLMTPPGIALAAVTAVAVGVTTYILSTRKEIKSTEEVLSDHAEAVKALGDAWGYAARQAKAMPIFDGRSADLLRAASSQSLDLAIARDTKDVLGDVSGFSPAGPGTSRLLTSVLGLGTYTAKEEFKEFSDAIEHLRKTADEGKPDIEGFRRLVSEQWALDPLNQDLTTSAGKLMDLTNGAMQAVAALQQLQRMQAARADAYRLYGMSREAGPASKAAADELKERLDAERDAATQAGIRARTHAERLESVRLQSGLGDPVGRADRMRVAELEERTRQEVELRDATKARADAQRVAIEQMTVERLSIGQTAGEMARLNTQARLYQELREQSDRTGLPISDEALANIREAASEMARLVDQNAQLKLANDLSFERDQLGRSDQDAAIADRLRGAGLDVDLDSGAAAAIRMNEVLKDQKNIWEDIRDSGLDAIDAIVDSGVDGFSNIGDVAADIGKDLLRDLTQLGIKNPIANALYDKGLPTLDGVGGVGGFFATLLGMTPNPAEGASAIGGQSVGAMTVSAATVIVNGSMLGAGIGGGESGPLAAITRLLNPANQNSATGGGAYGSDMAQNIRALAGNIGANPRDLAALMSFESGLNPDIWGGSGGRHYGLIQAGGPERAQYGITPGAPLADQFGGIERFFKDRGFQPGMSGLDLYSTVNAGRPGLYNASDAANGGTWGTVADKWTKQMGPHFERAEKLLGGFNENVSKTAGNLGQLGEGFGAFGDALSKFPAAPAGGGGIGGFFSSLFGGGLSSTFSGTAAYTAIQGGYAGGLYSDGGWTGGGDPSRVAGLVHQEEYVFSAPAVRAIGVSTLESMHRAAKSGRGYAEGGYAMPSGVGSGSRSGGWQGQQQPKIERHYHNYAGVQIREEESEDGQGGMREDIIIEKRLVAAASRQGSSFGKFLQAGGLQSRKPRR